MQPSTARSLPQWLLSLWRQVQWGQVQWGQVQWRQVPGRAGQWLPRGRDVSRAEWAWRHRVVCLVLAAHVPALAVAVLAVDRPHLLPAVYVVLALLGGACLGPLPRQLQALLAGGGLLLSSVLVVVLADGAADATVYYGVAVVLLALYRDWSVYALAVVIALAHRALISPAGAPEQSASGGAAWALLYALLVLAECAVLVLLWRASQHGRVAEEQRVHAELSAGRTTIEEQLAATDRMRADLIATVSHEFRTPLTGIRGSALTLLKRGDRLDKNGRDRLLHAVLDQQERLSRLLENMLLAAQATDADPSASAEVDAVAAEVAMLAAASRPGATGVSVVVAPGTVAKIDRQALHQVLANLVDNALVHGAPGTTPLVAGGIDERGVWVTVSNEGGVIDLTTQGRLFEPFTQISSGATRDREGIGVGLYVVRRRVEVYGGSIEVNSDSGWITVQIRLQPVRRGRAVGVRAEGAAQTDAPARLPTP
jgi:signal transduction histidine kinase